MALVGLGCESSRKVFDIAWSELISLEHESIEKGILSFQCLYGCCLAGFPETIGLQWAVAIGLQWAVAVRGTRRQFETVIQSVKAAHFCLGSDGQSEASRGTHTLTAASTK